MLFGSLNDGAPFDPKPSEKKRHLFLFFVLILVAYLVLGHEIFHPAEVSTFLQNIIFVAVDMS